MKMMIMTMETMTLRKIISFCKTVILFGLALITSCSQNPIFYTISQEIVPEEPIIPGSPTNMVEFKRDGVFRMYVASGEDLHWYNADGWDLADSLPQPGGRIIGLAATGNYLYALSIIDSGVTTTLRRIGSAGNVWETVSPDPDAGNYTLIQTIYAADTERLFAGAMNDSGNYGILYLDGTSDPLNPNLKLLLQMPLKDDKGNSVYNGMLSGAASRLESDGLHYYLSTRGKGVYKVAEADLSANAPAPAQLPENAETPVNDRLFMGMIKLDVKDSSGTIIAVTIIAVERNGGAFFEVQKSGLKQLSVATGKYATGALALWQNVNNENEKMLVAGIQGDLYNTTTSSSYTHGYVEFYIKPDGSLDLDGTRNDPPSITVNNPDRYTATIGKHPINHMHQVSWYVDLNMIFFASTQTDGLWSYRDRDGEPQWNAEN